MQRHLSLLFFPRKLSLGVVLASAVAIASCGRKEVADEFFEAGSFYAEPTSFTEMAGWEADDVSAALPAFVRSCAKMRFPTQQQTAMPENIAVNKVEALGATSNFTTVAGYTSEWRDVCDKAAQLIAAPDGEIKISARAFFETEFVPFRVANRRMPTADAPRRARPKIDFKGRFTGYFEPAYGASHSQTSTYSAPVYGRPDDLVMVDLGRFREDLAGTRIAGSVKNGHLIPYPDHAAINNGALGSRGEILAWMAPTDLLFLQIQGSGRLNLEDGGELRVGYDGQNGHPYTPVGRVLIRDGHVPREKMSMQAIRAWLDDANIEDAKALREENASYVFFRELDNLPDPELGPLGANSVQLTPTRSLAVDRRYHALGAPVWVSIEAEQENLPRDETEHSDIAETKVQRLFIAQDTGGAIRGPVRGDIYFGSGAVAGEKAGGFNMMGEMTVLLPKPLADRLLAQSDQPVSQ